MAPSIHLTSPENPHIKAVLRLRRHRERRRQGRLIAEGTREITRARDAGLDLLELFWCPTMVGDPSAAQGCMANRSSTARIFTVTDSLLGKMAYRQNPEGLLAVFQSPTWSLEGLDTGSTSSPGDGPPLWLVASGTQKPGNLGSMVRSADAAGCRGVLVADAQVDAFNPNAIRASTGAVFSLPVVAAPADLVVESLRAGGVRVIAATPSGGIPYTQADLSGPVAVVIGPEDSSLDPFWLTAAEAHVTIPMFSRAVDSLNASVSAAVLLFEAVRQRQVATL